LTWTIDGSLEGAGWNLFAYVVGNHTDPDVGSSMDQIGIVVQGGYYFTDDWEGFARYEWSDLDTPGLDDVSILTVGFNRYYAKHTLKWTTDLGYAFDAVPSNQLGIHPSGHRRRSGGGDGGRTADVRITSTPWL
jgi:hypothetical protein